MDLFTNVQNFHKLTKPRGGTWHTNQGTPMPIYALKISLLFLRTKFINELYLLMKFINEITGAIWDKISKTTEKCLL